MTAIIILNWNGSDDTLECLESLYKMTSDFYVVIMDNGSTDGSVERISSWLSDNGISVRNAHVGHILDCPPALRECILCSSATNMGYAKGNNEAIRLLGNYLPDSFLLLNNDTVVEPDFLDYLDVFASQHAEMQALTPMICLERRRDVVWNCGGRLALGMRKYYYANKSTAAVKRCDFLPVTFVTGCALYFRPTLLRGDGGIFTERFFFGEEDFNFCLRMKRERRKMACVLTSKIYHKVSASTSNKAHAGKIYIHYLNRFIDIRLNSTAAFYLLWAMVNVPYVTLLLARRSDIGLRRGLRIMRDVVRDSRRKDGVDSKCFTEAMNTNRH